MASQWPSSIVHKTHKLARECEQGIVMGCYDFLNLDLFTSASTVLPKCDKFSKILITSEMSAEQIQ